MLKITKHRDAASESVSFKLEGQLAGPWVEELDAAGKALLTSLWQQGAELRAAGCLTRCIVEEITKAGQADASRSSRKDRSEGS
jgi:hypothetical protein